MLNDNDVVILVVNRELLILPDQQWQLLSLHDLQRYDLSYGELIEVDTYRQGTCYIAELESRRPADSTINYRSIMGTHEATLDQLISRGLQLMTWHRQHQYCGQCGNKTSAHHADLALTCDRCLLDFYPRISPCVMCLVIKGDYCLLAHHERSKTKMYSTLAGFVEAGETLEQAVKREIQEEVSIGVKNLQYFSSQAWPFPHQLMVGFFAEYASGEIIEDGIEIKDAQWFHYTQLPIIPPIETLSGKLIHEFISKNKI